MKVSDSCMFPGVRKVYCSASGDSLRFKWTSASATQLENGNRTLILEKTQNENVTCHVENHVSRAYSSIQLDDCPGESGFFFFWNNKLNSHSNDEALAWLSQLMLSEKKPPDPQIIYMWCDVMQASVPMLMLKSYSNHPLLIRIYLTLTSFL